MELKIGWTSISITTKTRHFSNQWNPPKSNKQPYYTLKEPEQVLYAYDINATKTPLPPIPLSSPTRALGALLTPVNSTTYITTIKKQIDRLKQTLIKKKASI